MQWARTLLNSLRPARRRLVGSDLEGNKYYEIVREGRKARREVVTKLQHVEYEPGVIPVEWEAWIRGKRKEAPTHDELRKKLKQAEVLQKRVQQVEERERDLRTKEHEEGLVARPPAAQESRPVGHASAPFYEHMGNTQGPTSTGSTFQPGGWDPRESASTSTRASPADSNGDDARKDTFEPEAWVPPGDAKK